MKKRLRERQRRTFLSLGRRRNRGKRLVGERKGRRRLGRGNRGNVELHGGVAFALNGARVGFPSVCLRLRLVHNRLTRLHDERALADQRIRIYGNRRKKKTHESDDPLGGSFDGFDSFADRACIEIVEKYVQC